MKPTSDELQRTKKVFLVEAYNRYIQLVSAYIDMVCLYATRITSIRFLAVYAFAAENALATKIVSNFMFLN